MHDLLKLADEKEIVKAKKALTPQRTALLETLANGEWHRDWMGKNVNQSWMVKEVQVWVPNILTIVQ
jgi:hypothetical protein